jgi:hypothetical protein
MVIKIIPESKFVPSIAALKPTKCGKVPQENMNKFSVEKFHNVQPVTNKSEFSVPISLVVVLKVVVTDTDLKPIPKKLVLLIVMLILAVKLSIGLL